ncbi:3-dehydroquinate synthase [Ruminococcaceae bacterium OttesenSCG-928-L11]|nr:3-dehydroquinate synthase [Ruminococcaceae bacterium OttesenSCG-928-L11]MDL2233487.1 3-dehydroquinate synthase [Ruminococcaceae bacterium OttesenSCG-928-L11]
MAEIAVNAKIPYRVLVGQDILHTLGERIGALPHQRYHQVMVISDSNVAPLYMGQVQAALATCGLDFHPYVFPAGEASKAFSVAADIISALSGKGFGRKDLIIALGGGVTGDLSGFVAAIYQRGIDYIQIPTTFLAAIDSSVGGKTAVNIPEGKNLAGAFWQPRLVLCDIRTLDTLPEDTLIDGVAEAIKYGCIRDKALFEALAAGNRGYDLQQVIGECIAIKADIVAQDERDNGLRQILNFGHTAGHAIEKLSHFAISHGKAVGIGMVMAARAGEARGITQAGTAEQIARALQSNGLPTEAPYSVDDIARECLGDKKRESDCIHMILPEAIGRARIVPVPTNELAAFYRGE